MPKGVMPSPKWPKGRLVLSFFLEMSCVRFSLAGFFGDYSFQWVRVTKSKISPPRPSFAASLAAIKMNPRDADGLRSAGSFSSLRIATVKTLNTQHAVYVGSFDPLTLGHLDI